MKPAGWPEDILLFFLSLIWSTKRFQEFGIFKQVQIRQGWVPLVDPFASWKKMLKFELWTVNEYSYDLQLHNVSFSLSQ